MYTSINNVNNLYRWATYLCGKVGLKVSFFEPAPGKQPYATKHGINIPACVNMTREAEQNLRFYVLHECAHLGIGPDIFRLYEKHLGGAKHPIGIISNIIEDWRIEYVSAHAFKGDRQVIDEGRYNLLLSEDAVLQYAIKTGRKFDAESARFAAIGGMTKVVMAEYLPGFSALVPDHIKAYPPEIVEYCNRLTSNKLRDRLYALTCEEDTWRLSEDIYAWLWDKSQSEIEEEKERARKGEPESGDGEGESGEGEGDDGDGTGLGHGVTVTKDGEVKVNWRVFTASDHTDSKGDGSPLSIDYGDCHSRNEWVPYPPNRVISKKAKTLKGTEFAAGIAPTSPAFRNRVRQWLQARAAVAYDGGHKSGSIRAGQLWRGGVPAVGNAEWNQRVFKRPASDVDMDSAVLLLVDCSGSMSGSKIQTAASAAAQLCDVLKAVTVPVAVLGFTDDSGECTMFEFKGFGETVSTDDLLGRFAWVQSEMLGNADADAVLFAGKYLTDNITATRKVLIVLSDGCPTDCYSHGEGVLNRVAAADAGLRRVTTEMQDAFVTGKSNIELVGIGIRDESVKRYYRNHVVITATSQLEGTLLGIVKRTLA